MRSRMIRVDLAFGTSALVKVLPEVVGGEVRYPEPYDIAPCFVVVAVGTSEQLWWKGALRR